MIKKFSLYKAVAITSVAGMLGATLICSAVDPALSDVSDLYAAAVTAILTFIVAIVGAFITASLVPMGFRKLWHYVRKLLGLG